MKRIAAIFAILGFFLLAIVGWSKGVPVHICGLRALAGAGALYLVMSFAGVAVIRIIVDAVVEANRPPGQSKADET